MIGAIIGDIAAWTYEHDRETFWNQLISYDDKVSLSEFGRAYMQAVSRNLSALSNRETYTIDITDHSPNRFTFCNRAVAYVATNVSME